jgi:hypothetical protein
MNKCPFCDSKLIIMGPIVINGPDISRFNCGTLFRNNNNFIRSLYCTREENRKTSTAPNPLRPLPKSLYHNERATMVVRGNKIAEAMLNLSSLSNLEGTEAPPKR